MNLSQYKDYVLVLLFVKYVSDKNAGDPNAQIEIPEGGGFADMVAMKGNKEIREKIIKKGYIKGIIGLPANLFYGTGIPACILVIDKENANAGTGIFMVDASSPPLMIAMLLLSACATGGSDRSGRVCPPVVDYSAKDQANAAAEVEASPDDAVVVRMLSDYAVMHEQARSGR